MAKELTLQSGVVVKVHPVPSMVVLAIQEQNPEPGVPSWFNEPKGRTETNPSDPAYLRAVEAHKLHMIQKINDMYLAMGVEVIELADKQPLEADSWTEGLKYAGLTVPETGMGRKVAWLKWHVIDDADIGNVIQAIAVAGGLVSEEQVGQAAESFRSDQGGDQLAEVQAPTELRQWDTPVSDARDSSSIGMQGDSQVHVEDMGTMADFR